MLGTSVCVGATETEGECPKNDSRSIKSDASEKESRSASDAKILEKLMTQIGDIKKKMTVAVDDYLQEIKDLRAENRKLNDELKQNHEMLLAIATELGVRNLNSASSAEILSDMRGKVEGAARLPGPRTGFLDEKEWRTVVVSLDGGDSIIEKIKGYENFIKKYQKQKVVIVEN